MIDYEDYYINKCIEELEFILGMGLFQAQKDAVRALFTEIYGAD